MRKLIWWFAAAVAVVLFALYLRDIAGESGSVKQLTHLPWQIETLPGGGSRVFNVELGKTTLREARADWRAEPALGLFQDAAGTRRLEAFFEKIRLGIFEAHVVLSLVAAPEQLAGFAERGGKREPQPSGERKSELNAADSEASSDLVVDAITYVPVAQYDPEIITQRFGEPDSKRTLDETRTLWLYPAKGLAIIHDSKKREVLHFTAPAVFADLQRRLEGS